MESRPPGTTWMIVRSVNGHPELLTYLFQLLLLSAVFESMFPYLAGIALIVALLLATAHILCTFPGNYFYYFPKGMRI